MATVAEGLAAQLRNIETTYGRSVDDWSNLIRASGRSRHGEIVALLKSEYGLSHGAANRLALVALDASSPESDRDPQGALYQDRRQSLLPIHGRLMALVHGLGDDIEIAPKKGYLSLRRRKQFAMIKPGARHVDLGLILPGRVPYSPTGSRSGQPMSSTTNSRAGSQPRMRRPAQARAKMKRSPGPQPTRESGLKQESVSQRYGDG